MIQTADLSTELAVFSRPPCSTEERKSKGEGSASASPSEALGCEGCRGGERSGGGQGSNHRFGDSLSGFTGREGGREGGKEVGVPFFLYMCIAKYLSVYVVHVNLIGRKNLLHVDYTVHNFSSVHKLYMYMY